LLFFDGDDGPGGDMDQVGQLLLRQAGRAAQFFDFCYHLHIPFCADSRQWRDLSVGNDAGG